MKKPYMLTFEAALNEYCDELAKDHASDEDPAASVAAHVLRAMTQAFLQVALIASGNAEEHTDEEAKDILKAAIARETSVIIDQDFAKARAFIRGMMKKPEAAPAGFTFGKPPVKANC